MLCWEKSSTFGVQSIDIDPIPCYGTTHADYFYGEIPCVRCLTKEEINSAYEENTGHLIVSEFKPHEEGCNGSSCSVVQESWFFFLGQGCKGGRPQCGGS